MTDEDKKDFKCPVCGFSYGDFPRVRDPEEALKARKETTKTVLRNAINAIVNNVSSHRSASGTKGVDKFIADIQNINDASVEFATHEFLRRKLWSRGLGLAYLAGMIKRHEASREQIKEYERQLYGSSPPLRTIEDE